MSHLGFSEIRSREERVADAYTRTFEWIFQGSDDCPGQWSNFVDWLQSGDRLYWITGKAGSGKSTLMKYILHDLPHTYCKASENVGWRRRPNYCILLLLGPRNRVAEHQRRLATHPSSSSFKRDDVSDIRQCPTTLELIRAIQRYDSFLDLG